MVASTTARPKMGAAMRGQVSKESMPPLHSAAPMRASGASIESIILAADSCQTVLPGAAEGPFGASGGCRGARAENPRGSRPPPTQAPSP